MNQKFNTVRKQIAEYQQKLLAEGKIDMIIAVDKVALIINENLNEDVKDN